MKPYGSWRPTGFDAAGLSLPNQQDWLVLDCCARNRDSDCLAESNFRIARDILERVDGYGDDHEVHRFGHWANGWFELIVVRPGTAAAKEAEGIEAALANYPILNEEDHSRREEEAANEVWRTCYSVAERIEYIDSHRSQFEFHGFADMLGCVRGKHFSGYASELLC